MAYQSPSRPARSSMRPSNRRKTIRRRLSSDAGNVARLKVAAMLKSYGWFRQVDCEHVTHQSQSVAPGIFLKILDPLFRQQCIRDHDERRRRQNEKPANPTPHDLKVLTVLLFLLHVCSRLLPTVLKRPLQMAVQRQRMGHLFKAFRSVLLRRQEVIPGAAFTSFWSLSKRVGLGETLCTR